MEQIKPQEDIYLVNSDYLKVIKIAGYSGNLSLTTCVRVNTNDNSTIVKYKVYSWHTKHRRIEKIFTNYTEAIKYYKKIYQKFEKKY